MSIETLPPVNRRRSRLDAEVTRAAALTAENRRLKEEIATLKSRLEAVSDAVGVKLVDYADGDTHCVAAIVQEINRLRGIAEQVKVAEAADTANPIPVHEQWQCTACDSEINPAGVHQAIVVNGSAVQPTRRNVVLYCQACKAVHTGHRVLAGGMWGKVQGIRTFRGEQADRLLLNLDATLGVRRIEHLASVDAAYENDTMTFTGPDPFEPQ